MTIETQKLRGLAKSAQGFAAVGVVQWPQSAKAHINGLADTVIRCSDTIDVQAAEISALRANSGYGIKERDFLAAENERLRNACEKAIEWLEGWASAEPYLTELRAALAQQEQGK